MEPAPDSVNAVRRFPLPWKIVEGVNAFWVEDAEGKAFGYCHFAPEEDRSIGSYDYRKLYRHEALRIVRNIAKLPELLAR